MAYSSPTPMSQPTYRVYVQAKTTDVELEISIPAESIFGTEAERDAAFQKALNLFATSPDFYLPGQGTKTHGLLSMATPDVADA